MPLLLANILTITLKLSIYSFRVSLSLAVLQERTTCSLYPLNSALSVLAESELWKWKWSNTAGLAHSNSLSLSVPENTFFDDSTMLLSSMWTIYFYFHSVQGYLPYSYRVLVCVIYNSTSHNRIFCSITVPYYVSNVEIL